MVGTHAQGMRNTAAVTVRVHMEAVENAVSPPYVLLSRTMQDPGRCNAMLHATGVKRFRTCPCRANERLACTCIW